MGNFFKSLFFSSQETSEVEIHKNDRKKFDVLKYDGIRALRIGKLAYAIKCLVEALELQEDFEARTYLVTAYTSAHKLEEAMAELDRLVELDPIHIQTRLSRINLLFMLDREGEVEADCREIIKLEETNYLAWYLMGKAKYILNNPLGAIADLTKAITLKDDFVDAYWMRAQVLLVMRQVSEALLDVEKAIQLNPEEENLYLLRGRIRLVLDDKEAALVDFQNVLDLNPYNEEAGLSIGQLLIDQERLDEAIHFFDELIELKPEFAKAYAERGRAKNKKGDKVGAFEDLKKSIELNPVGDEAQRLEGVHSNFDNLYKGGFF